MIIQIYEIQTPQEAEKCIEAGVSHIGSVLPGLDAWRMPLVRETTRLVRQSGAKSSLIPLFHHLDTTFRALDYYQPDFIHFCDALTDSKGRPSEVERFARFQWKIKEKFPEMGIVRSLPIPAQGLDTDLPFLDLMGILKDSSDFFLIDTWVPDAPEAGYIGITGAPADREKAKSLVTGSRRPVILAGGLSPENVYESILAVRPAGVDSCTRTNRTTPDGSVIRFQKDFEKVGRFVAEVKRAGMVLKTEKEELVKKLEKLRADLKDREAALPAHSVRPHQILLIESLEAEIEAAERAIERFPVL